MGNTKLEICMKCWGTGHVHGGDENSTWSKSCEACHGVGFIRVPMTNADRIRAMTDEELVENFRDLMPDELFCSGVCPDGGQDSIPPCDLCRLKWLKQPAEGGMRDGI